jgi:hypothetical protein
MLNALTTGGVAGFSAALDERYNAPPGCFMKVFNMADTYADTLRRLKIQHPDATLKDLRYTILPPVVADIYKDWSPQKQEYIVWAGVKTWFGKESWEGLGEHCTKNVNKCGYMSGPGDRALFGWSKEDGDRYCSIEETVSWTDDEGEEESEDPKEDEKEDEGKPMSSAKGKEVAEEDEPEEKPMSSIKGKEVAVAAGKRKTVTKSAKLNTKTKRSLQCGERVGLCSVPSNHNNNIQSTDAECHERQSYDAKYDQGENGNIKR